MRTGTTPITRSLPAYLYAEYSIYAHIAQKIRGVSGYKGTFHSRSVLESRTRRTNTEMPVMRKNAQKTGAVERSKVSKPPWPCQLSGSKPIRLTRALIRLRPQLVPTRATRNRVIAVCISIDNTGTERLGCQRLSQFNAG